MQELAFSPRTRLQAAIGCLDMAKAHYKGAKVHAGALKLSETSTKTAFPPAPAAKKKTQNAPIRFENGPVWRAQIVRRPPFALGSAGDTTSAHTNPGHASGYVSGSGVTPNFFNMYTHCTR